MQSKRPSPALVVSIIALIVALSGTAVAAKFIITNSGQVKDGSLVGQDLAAGSVSKSRLSTGVQALLSRAPAAKAAGTQALEVHRLKGPDVADGSKAQVLSLDLPAGTYAVFAKATVEPFDYKNLLDTLLQTPRTIAASCTLDVAGTGDYAIEPILSFGSANPATLNVQATRTLAQPGKATLTCGPDTAVHWAARDASIIALQVAGTQRTEQ